MKSKEVTIDGITYTVRATTEAGLKRGVSQLKRSLKKQKDTDERGE